ncbi:MAG: hypothetical protein R3B48_14985 [Kofleriaceae bacterium]
MTWLPLNLRAGLTVAAVVVFPACFGDNSDEPGPNGPAVTDVAAPDGLDPGDTASITIKVKGKPATQLSIGAAGVLGAFRQEFKDVITDGAGEASWVAEYLVGNASGDDILTVTVQDIAGSADAATKSMTIYAIERLGNVTPVGPEVLQSSGVLLAYPMVLDQPRVVTKLGIVSPPQLAPVSTQLGLYATDTATSVRVLAKTTANIVGGINEIAIPKQELAAGSYWMVVAYDGSPQIYRSTVEVEVRYKVGHVFSTGLADTITDLFTSTATSPFFERNFFLVVRQ